MNKRQSQNGVIAATGKGTRVIPFKTQTGIPPDLPQRLLTRGAAFGLTAVVPFDVDSIVVAEWVNLKCRYGCNRYGTNWCCPPATPGPARVRKILDEYKVALLLEGSKTCEEFYRDSARKRALQVKCWKEAVSLERVLFLEGYYKAFSLVGECCALCRDCAYPEPCRFPQEKRPSVESFSIDVIGTLRNLGRTANVAEDPASSYRYYGIILLT